MAIACNKSTHLTRVGAFVIIVCMNKNIKQLFKKPIFYTQDARRLGLRPGTLSYYANKGVVKRLRRGVYANPLVDLKVDLQWEDLVLASKCMPCGVVCLTSALAVHGLTDEVPRQHWLAVPHTTTAPRYPMARIVRMRNMTLGRTQIKMGAQSVVIFNPERTIVDAFRCLDFEVAIKALRAGLMAPQTAKVSLKKLCLYAKKMRVNIDPYIMAVTT